MGVEATMLAIVRPAPDDPDWRVGEQRDETIRHLAYELLAGFGKKWFFISHPGEYDWDPEGRRVLQVVDEFDQDGPTLRPKRGEVFLRVNLSGRYYGEGYERGFLPIYCAIAEWLEIRLPVGATIHYGGDSSGVVVEPFDAAARRELFEHFAREGTFPYYGETRPWVLEDGSRSSRRSIFDDGSDTPDCPLCRVRLCVNGSRPADYRSGYCLGCGFAMERIKKVDGGFLWRPGDRSARYEKAGNLTSLLAATEIGLEAVLRVLPPARLAELKARVLSFDPQADPPEEKRDAAKPDPTLPEVYP